MGKRRIPDGLVPMTQLSQELCQSRVRLALAMQQAEISSSELAERVSFSRSYLYELLGGDIDLAHVTGRILIELSDTLNVSVDFLLGRWICAKGCHE